MDKLKVRTTISGSVSADALDEVVTKQSAGKAGDCGCNECQGKNKAGMRKAG